MNQTQIRRLEEKYREHITQHRGITDEDLRVSFLKILELRNPLHRVEEWKNLKVKVSSFRQLVYLANPFFIGYGNPESGILFLGKE